MARSLVALICLVALPRLVAGQADTTRADSTSPGVRPTFSVAPLVLREPPVLRAPWLGAPRPPSAIRGIAWDSTVSGVLDSARTDRATALRYRTLYGQPLQAQQPESTETTPQRRGVLGLSPKYADLELDGQVRLELRTDRLRNERCSPALLLDPNSGCRGGFKPPRLDNQVNLRSGGTIGRRVHVNVDYDTERDFTANNNVQVYYQGLEDEIIRRIEVGTVTFQPPASRFITAAIPANNFGVNARFEVGSFQFQALAATQKGSQVAERSYTVGQTTSQPQDRQLRDLDFESGRFFWVVDPTSALPGYPAIDILNLSAASLAPTDRPAQVRVYRYRPPQNQSGTDPNLGGITALARTIDPNQGFGPVRWQLLIQGSDYYLDPSGLWFALATKLDQNDYLAVSYTTAAGTTVGSFPSQDQGQGSSDSLRLVVQPQRGPESVTFRHEMRQIYRAAGSDLDPASLQVNLSVNRTERPQGGGTTYLALLGLAVATDQNVFDRDNRLFPRTRDPDAAQVLRESYIVFPTLTPFSDPRLSPAERSDSLYRTPLYLLLAQGPSAKFQVRLRYNSTGAGDRSTLSLGALQIREESEQLLLGGRRLERGVDYTISYDLGQVTFLNPDALFGGSAGQVTARFEEQGIFAVAPTTILGLSTQYRLGEAGAINLIGMYQREQSAFNRPPLGFEASANLVGGINTELSFKPMGLTRLLSKLTSTPAVAPSLLDLNAELAFTKPDPNRSGQAYLEEFEAEAGIPISLRETVWEFGSRPQQADGISELVGGVFDPEDAVALTWQNLIPLTPGSNQPVELRPEDIDTLIRLSGRGERLETAMYLTLHADTAGGIVQQSNASRWSLPERPSRPRWRSMVTSLSPTGVDLTRDEYLEFWVFQPGTRTAASAGVRLVFDLGTVNEDALALAPQVITATGTDTAFTGRQYVGQGRLDTERSTFDIFDAQVDDVGILGDRPDVLEDGPTGQPVEGLALCQRLLGTSVPVFPWGDLSGRCSRGNGSLDTEDLNGDNVLNAAGANENIFRYVVSLTPGDKYFVRNGVQRQESNGTVSGWQLYRIPIRTPDATIGTPSFRLIQHLRMTAAAPADAGVSDVVARFALARLRLVGSPWVRRAEAPIAGISGSAAEPSGEVIASVISTENRTDLGYESPPGVFESVSRRGGDRSTLGSQINEKSLRLIGRGLEVGERAEAYLRLPTGPQNVLRYRQLRVWMRGRGEGWEQGDFQAFIKLGSDDRNFYLYRAAARSTTWEPEFDIDLEVWRRLRADIESRWLSGAPASGAECGSLDVNAYVACEGPYLVHVADPGINPPNLAAVQEISAGIYRVGGAVGVPDAELWVDDVRLTSPVSEVGTAMAMDARLVASDVANVNASFIRQDGQFHQINSDPSYRTAGTFQLNSNWRLDRFLPAGLGLSIPLTAAYSRSDVTPELLTGTDLRGDALEGLRKPHSWTGNYSLAIRRNQRGRSWPIRGLVDPLSLVGTLTQGRSRTELSDANSDAYSLALGYNLQLERRGPRLPFGGIIKGLPAWIRESDGGKALTNASLSLVPSNVRWSSGLTKNQADYSLFAVPVARDDDFLITPTLSLTHLWRNSAGLTWQPLGMLSLIGDLSSTRDLRVYPDSTSLGRLAYEERRFLAGVPVGVERDRVLTTALSLAPRLSSWLRPRFTTSSNFLLSRTLTSRDPVREDGDSGVFILPQTLNNSRSRDIGVSLDLSRALRQIWSDSSGLGKAVARVRPLDFSSRLSRSSTYDLTAFAPDLGFMLGLGGRDRFLSHEGESARGITETRTATISSGAELPLGFSATVSYSLTRTDRFQLLGGAFAETVTRQREWPVGNVRWSRTFAGGPLTLVAAGAGLRHRRGTSSQPSGGGTVANSAISSYALNPDLQLSFRNGLALTVALATRSQRTENNGNATELDQDDLTGSVNYSFALPAAISRVRKQVRSTLTALSSKTLTCLEQGSDPGCMVVSDLRRQEIRGGLDTDLLKTVSGGLQFGYSTSDARHISRRTSQIFLMLTFQLSLYAGDYR
ncbi:MAG: cell surface protein SprA [Gemmatimonadales bacterium]|nr:cell surface protein SprA [Gemmatimonadales bacterium]